MSWREEWERTAHAEGQEQRAQPLATLLADVRAGRYGAYFGIWDAIAAKATLAEAAPTLLDVLEHEPEYLHRYHCAAALLRLLGSVRWQPVQLANDTSERPAHLAALRAEVARKLQ